MEKKPEFWLKPVSGIKNVHLFRIEVEEKYFNDMQEKVGKTIRRLDLEFKHSN